MQRGVSLKLSGGILFVFSGPSGVGKGTVLDRLFEKYDGVEYSISMTTRPPRDHEENGEDYYFVEEDEFERIKAEEGFIEWAEVHGYLYGTPKKFVKEALEAGKDVILEIDIQGARQVRKIFPEAVFIFLEPPSFSALEKRLASRDSEDNEMRKLRLENARKEIEEASRYDYRVVNDDIDETAERLIGIFEKEKNRR
ncbi:guanylate kinase [Halarsenatibacter silvermanii]|uniref:Guanylate kinase n=1 Tax=Halarsenatibacter silvermanii TaxID=321763 RepID=A0A1G9JJS0_9FIRM|nr:guanylate kinase [Halarsenatibacter silvermanii]